jgi:hypothetical protein
MDSRSLLKIGCLQCRLHCRIKPYWIKAAPQAVPLAAPATRLGVEPARRGRAAAAESPEISKLIRHACRVQDGAVFLASDCRARGHCVNDAPSGVASDRH